MNDSAEHLQLLNNAKADQQTAVIVYIMFTMVFGLVGNVLVSYIYYFKLDKTPNNFFIVILSLCDLFGCLTCMPMDIGVLRHPYTFRNPVICKFMRYFVMTVSVTSGLIIFIISIDRFRKVCRPLKKQFTRRSAIVISTVLCFLSAVLGSPALAVYGTRRVQIPGSSLNGTECSLDGKVDKIYPLVFYLTLSSACVVILVLLSAVYCVIGVKLMRYKRKRKRLLSNLPSEVDKPSNDLTDSRDYIEENKRIEQIEMNPRKRAPTVSEPRRRRVSFMHMTRTTLMMFFITLVWIISYVPHLVAVACLITVKDFKSSLSVSNLILYGIFSRSYYFNNAVNPWIYGIFNFKFRNQLLICLRSATNCFRGK